jgi:hypothetical protein
VAKLESIAVWIISVMTVITAIPTALRSEEGQDERRSCPNRPAPKRRHSGEGKSQRARILE